MEGFAKKINHLSIIRGLFVISGFTLVWFFFHSLYDRHFDYFSPNWPSAEIRILFSVILIVIGIVYFFLMWFLEDLDIWMWKISFYFQLGVITIITIFFVYLLGNFGDFVWYPVCIAFQIVNIFVLWRFKSDFN